MNASRLREEWGADVPLHDAVLQPSRTDFIMHRIQDVCMLIMFSVVANTVIVSAMCSYAPSKTSTRKRVRWSDDVGCAPKKDPVKPLPDAAEKRASAWKPDESRCINECDDDDDDEDEDTDEDGNGEDGGEQQRGNAVQGGMQTGSSICTMQGDNDINKHWLAMPEDVWRTRLMLVNGNRADVAVTRPKDPQEHQHQPPACNAWVLDRIASEWKAASVPVTQGQFRLTHATGPPALCTGSSIEWRV